MTISMGMPGMEGALKEVEKTKKTKGGDNEGTVGDDTIKDCVDMVGD